MAQYMISANEDVLAAIAATLRGQVENVDFDHHHFARETWTVVEEIALGIEQLVPTSKHLFGIGSNLREPVTA